MKKRVSHPLRLSLQAMAMVSFMLGSVNVQAADAQALATQHLCMSCHKVDGKLVGPGYKEVAAKYKGNAGALAALTNKVRSGGKGVWGKVPMPPQKEVSDGDLKAILTWVLAQ